MTTHRFGEFDRIVNGDGVQGDGIHLHSPSSRVDEEGWEERVAGGDRRGDNDGVMDLDKMFHR